jgi:ferredoxin
MGIKNSARDKRRRTHALLRSCCWLHGLDGCWGGEWTDPRKDLLSSHAGVEILESNQWGRAMKFKVDQELCIGCGACEETCPEIFELYHDLSYVVLDKILIFLIQLLRPSF